MSLPRFRGRSKWFHVRVSFLVLVFLATGMPSLGNPGGAALEGDGRLVLGFMAGVPFVGFGCFWFLVLKVMGWAGSPLRGPDWDASFSDGFGETKNAPTHIQFIGVMFLVAGIGLSLQGLIAGSSVLVLFALMPIFAGLGTLAAVRLAVKEASGSVAGEEHDSP